MFLRKSQGAQAQGINNSIGLLATWSIWQFLQLKTQLKITQNYIYTLSSRHIQQAEFEVIL